MKPVTVRLVLFMVFCLGQIGAFDLSKGRGTRVVKIFEERSGFRAQAKGTFKRKAPLRMSSSSGLASSEGSFDAEAVGKWSIALGTQMSLITLLFTGMDKLVTTTDAIIPAQAVFLFFYFFLLKTRVFNPLSNNRPKPKNLETVDSPKRNMPSWTPPGFIFPIMWLLIIGPLRAAAATLVYKSTGSFANPTLLTLILHLSIGDIWNTINNIERRYGTSVVGVGFVWFSKALAAYSFYQVNPLAGKLLGVTMIWLSIAWTLIFSTWRINPDPSTGKPESLLPRKKGESSVTRFAWFQKS